MAKKRGIGFPTVAVLLLAAGAGAWFARERGWLGGTAEVPLRGATVERGVLDVRVVEKGNLKAKNAVSLRSELEGRTTVLSLVPEGTRVTAGTVVAELDASELVDRRLAQEISVQSAEANFTKARESYEIQRLQNESDVAAARQRLEFARTDLRKYEEGDWPQTLTKAEEDIVLAEEELSRAQERYTWSQELAESGFLTRTELEGDRLNYERNRILLDQTKRAKQLLIEFDNPKELARLRADVEEAERELQRVERQAASRLVDFESDRASAEAKLQLEREQLAKMVDQIGKARLIAPVDGLVVYAREEGSRWRGGDPISEGAEVRERQEIINIPTTGGIIAEASIHESVLKQVEVGQRCELRVDAIPGRTFDGRVSFLALLPDQNSWWANPDLRVYRCEIQVDSPIDEMRPGMSCSVTILVDRVDDALLVPLQSVFPTAEGPIAFVVDGAGEPQRRALEVGRDDDRRVEILAGLQAGETVLLAPPDGFAPQSAPAAGAGAGPNGATRPGGGERPAGAASGGEGGGRGEGARPGGGPRPDGAARPAGGGRPERRGGGERGEGGAPPRATGATADEAAPAAGAGVEDAAAESGPSGADGR